MQQLPFAPFWTLASPCLLLLTGRGRYKPTLLNDRPWLLLIVIAKHKVIENCLLWNLNGISISEGIKFIHEMKILSPIFDYVITAPQITFFFKSITCNLVQLQRPLALSIFLKSIIGMPTFKRRR